VEPFNWVDPSIALMRDDPRVAVANPDWGRDDPRTETLEFKDGFSLGYGFSDQVFLVRRSEFARPIYRTRCCPVSLRYPLAHVAAVFEQRVDAYMRAHRRLRATHLRAVYRHPASEGSAYPDTTAFENLRRLRNAAIVKALRWLPLRHPRCRL
jgi:hypothetical protein